MAKKTELIDNQIFEEEAELKQRAEVFLDEIKARGGFKRLYSLEHTNKVVQHQCITLGYFYKLIKRTPKGIGLFNNPLLLGAVLKDMAYPADLLFGCTEVPSASVALKLGPGVASEIQEIVANALQQMERKPIRQEGLKKQFLTASYVLSIAKKLQEDSNYAFAIFALFFRFSLQHLKSFPHSRTKDIETVDRLCKHCMDPLNNSNDSGSLLTLSYLLYEICKIGNGLTSATEHSKIFRAVRQPLINGFQFMDNLQPSDLLIYLREIPKVFDDIVQNYLGKIYPNKIYENGVEMDYTSYLPLSTTTASQCIQYAQICLERLATLDMTVGVKSSGNSLYDFAYDELVGLKPGISPHFTVKFDASLRDDFQHLHDSLKNFFNPDSSMPNNRRKIKLKIH